MHTCPARPLARKGGALAALLLAPWLAAAPALAQSSPPIPRMPMPPSASDPAPVESKAKAQPRKAKPAAKASTGTDGEAKPKPRKSSSAAPASGSSSYERPSRYVPDEFDRRGEDTGSRAKPFVSESGRAGMGMRF